jgi:hypothetical protein
MKITFLVLLIFSAIFSQLATSQTGRPYLNIEREIEAYLLQKYLKKYIVAVDPFDTLLVIVRDAVTDEEFLDPYGTLKGKMFLSAWEATEEGIAIPEAKQILGFSSGGVLLWQSGPMCACGGAYVMGSSDLNKDGEVDVLVSVRDADQDKDYLSYLWIFSWNGTRARILNDINPQTGQSVLLSGDDWYQLFDWEGGGIMEIWAFWDKENALFPDSLMNTRPYVTYSYNGSLYGLWPSTVQIPSTTFLANNRLSVKASCRVTRSGSSFNYDYRWLNDPTSIQKIRSIFLKDIDQGATMISPPVWLTLLPTKPFNAVLWDLEDSQKRRMIKVGETRGGFGLQDTCLPSIVRYFVKGYAPSSTFWDDQQQHTDEEVRNDLLANSVIGYTIGPKILVAPFDPLGFLDTLSSFTTQSRSLGWITSQPVTDSYLGYFTTTKSQLQSNNNTGARATLQTVLQNANVDSSSTLTSEAYALIRFNTEYLLEQLPTSSPGLLVKLVNSGGANLTGGSLQYYERGWKDAMDNNDGTFTVTTALQTVSLRMTYAYGIQTKSNVPVGGGSVVFQTVNATVRLVNSLRNPIDTGKVQYYAGAWREFGTTANGVATKELLPIQYSFRMTYASGSNDKSQKLDSSVTVVFQTVNTTVQLQNSQGSLIDQGTVQYYSGAWRNFGTTNNGVATKELLPNNYSFRMTYAFANNDKQQNIELNPTVIFQTVNATVELRNSQSSFIDQGTVQYYSGAWRELGTTANGVVTKELLPNNYSFRMTFAYASNDKQQNIGTNPIVVFQTTNATVQLQNSQGSFIDQGTVQYYAGAWRQFGTTSSGVVTKELLPNNYSFRMTYAYASNDKQHNIATNPTIIFQTVNATVELRNSQGNMIDQGTVQYYSGAWRNFGTTSNGVATKELLPNIYSFRMTYAFASNDKQQNIGTNPTAVFQTVNTIVELRNSQGSLIDQGTVQYYSGAWRSFGTTTSGLAVKELLPLNYSFRLTHEFISVDKAQDISANSTVSFSTVSCTVRVEDAQNQPVNNAQARYYAGAWRLIGTTVNGKVTKELLPVNLTFRINYGAMQQDKAQNLSTNNVVEFVIQ